MYVFTGVVFLTLFLIHLYHFCLFFSPFYKQPQHRLTKRCVTSNLPIIRIFHETNFLSVRLSNFFLQRVSSPFLCLSFNPITCTTPLPCRNLGLCWLYTGGKVLCLAICLSVWRIDMKQMVCTSTHHVGHHTLKNASLLDSE
ncbi:PREDICTED: uncharacterized protein LOC104766513 isoform X1 [Camelina sativa]|uniref:Uncharacterized protein LOC104766513 isoform X1 n=1 Tax=Camelina sativa TaxID=90675 RepID=A0ABM0XNY0_CAMSA|nr:PREDICTED: uncharacterized protein LOC104766513 isoform X1 [Camelina sativa]